MANEDGGDVFILPSACDMLAARAHCTKMQTGCQPYDLHGGHYDDDAGAVPGLT